MPLRHVQLPTTRTLTGCRAVPRHRCPVPGQARNGWRDPSSIRFHRGLVQLAPASHQPRLPQSRRIRDRTRSLTTTPMVSAKAEQAQVGPGPDRRTTRRARQHRQHRRPLRRPRRPGLRGGLRALAVRARARVPRRDIPGRSSRLRARLRAADPESPPPSFAYFHDDQYVCGFDMYIHTWSHEITGPGADLIRTGLSRPESRRRGEGTRRTVPLSPCWSSAFELALPRDLILGTSLPTVLVRDQQPR